MALCAGNSPAPVNYPHKGQWRGDLMFSLICAWINGWVNNREAGDLIRHRGHYDVSVMVINGTGNGLVAKQNSSWRRHQMETFSALLASVRGIHRSWADCPLKGHWHRALMFSLNCAWTIGRANTRDPGDLRRNRAQYEVTVMVTF